MPGAAALQLSQTGPASRETLALPFLAQFWKNQVPMLVAVKTSSKPGTEAWRGSCSLQAAFVPSC